MNETYKVTDKRRGKGNREVCRVCASEEVHSHNYTTPTMECIVYLKSQIARSGVGADKEMEEPK